MWLVALAALAALAAAAVAPTSAQGPCAAACVRATSVCRVFCLAYGCPCSRRHPRGLFMYDELKNAIPSCLEVWAGTETGGGERSYFVSAFIGIS